MSEPKVYLARAGEFTDALVIVEDGVRLDYLVSDDYEQMEKEALDVLLEKGADEMGARLYDKVEMGWSGWDLPENKELLKQKLLENYREEDWIDVANLALFLWNLEPTEEES